MTDPSFLDLVRALGDATLKVCNGDRDPDDDDACDPAAHRREAATLLAILQQDPALAHAIAGWTAPRRRGVVISAETMRAAWQGPAR